MEQSNLTPGTTLQNGKYTIQKALGQGGFGITYLADFNALKEKVAIKEMFVSGYCVRNTQNPGITLQTLSKEAFGKLKERFLQEARLLYLFRSEPGLVSVTDVFEENNTAYFVMDYVEGQTLSQLIAGRGKTVDEQEITGYIKQVLEALGKVHAKNLLHRDIKPENILITPEGKAVLIDFGTARQFTGDKSIIHTTMLTPGYAAPEQYGQRSKPTPATDIYAVGATLYFCLTGKRPLQASDRYDPGSTKDHLVPPIEENPQISHHINVVILKAMQMMKEYRYQSTVEMLAALQNEPPSASAEDKYRELFARFYKDGKGGMTDSKRLRLQEEQYKLGLSSHQVQQIENEVKSKADTVIIDNHGKDKPKREIRKKFPVFAIVLPILLVAIAFVVYTNGQKQKAAKGKRYYTYVHAGDSLQADSSYQPSIVQYEKALALYPDSGQVQQKIKEINDLLARLEEERKAKAGRIERERIAGENRKNEAARIEREHQDEPPSVATFRNFTETVAGIQINMVAVKGGTFQMGRNDGEPNEKPEHPVTVSNFYMGKYEVTFAQYDAFCEATGKSRPGDQGWGRGNRPVINVSWNDAVAYCQWLSQQTGKTYRLPTEAEWEYACRAGTTTPFNTGNCLSTSQANYNGNYPYTDCSKGEYRKTTLPVGSFSPNAWGLFDMHGNVWEWCSDWYDAGYYANSPRNNPPGPPSSPISLRVVRGGSWFYVAEICRVSYRADRNPGRSYSSSGFRLVLAKDYNEQNTSKQGNLEKQITSQPKAVEQKPIDTNTKFINFTETAGKVNIEMVAVKGGTFSMGSNDGEDREKPVHSVTVSDFYMGKYEVTFAQYDAYCEATGKSKPADQGWGRGNRPVINVSWNDAVAYCNWISQQTGKTYRLPTEAEWEYACRAGTTTPFNTGNCLSTSQANYDGNYPYTGCDKGEYRQKTMPVGSFSPNAWGLFDMHGNVWEWCNDWYDAGYYANSPRNNPPSPPSGSYRVLRGGSWLSYAKYCRVSYRGNDNPGIGSYYSGFRLVLAKDYNEQDTPKQKIKDKPITSQPEAVAKKPSDTNTKFINFTETAGKVNIEMVAVKGGTFSMGSNDGEPNEKPAHPVTVSDFYMGKFEVTFAQYDAFCEATGNRKPSDQSWGRGNRPVINVGWNDAVAYCNWISQQTGKTYRLPTEAEWEYACRAGTTTPFNTGNCLSSSQANYSGLFPYIGCSKGEYREKTLPVGSFFRNAWGLCDMHGNVWEWCSDWYDGSYYANSPSDNPPGPSSSPDSGRVLRGGGWRYSATACTVSFRRSHDPSYGADYDGFRLVLAPVQ